MGAPGLTPHFVARHVHVPRAMNKTFISIAVASTLALAAVACDKSAAEAQDKANKAQGEANLTSAEAQREADKKINNAQAEGDKKVAEAQGDWAKTREDFRHSTQTKLDALDKKIAILEADAKKATGKEKVDLDARLANIRTRRTAFGTEFKTLDTSTASTWDATKARLDKSWDDLDNAVDKHL